MLFPSIGEGSVDIVLVDKICIIIKLLIVYTAHKKDVQKYHQ